MYLDLLACGMDKTLAHEFYSQIRCLSRANIVAQPHLKSWQVCFSYDYSTIIGNLLANYILRDMTLISRQTLNSTDNFQQTNRFFSFASAKRNRHLSSGLLRIFRGHGRFPKYIPKVTAKEKACCEKCTHSGYFVNVDKRTCLKDPFGKHCCHKACEALRRLKIGASSSMSFCCIRCRPLPCA